MLKRPWMAESNAVNHTIVNNQVAISASERFALGGIKATAERSPSINNEPVSDGRRVGVLTFPTNVVEINQ